MVFSVEPAEQHGRLGERSTPDGQRRPSILVVSIYVIASKSSEGFPRTIWEAIVHSLPVVATRVGLIPDFVQDAALIVEPNSTRELAGALRDILHNPAKRRGMIKRGRELAATVTLEQQTEVMVQRLKSWARIPQ